MDKTKAILVVAVIVIAGGVGFLFSRSYNEGGEPVGKVEAGPTAVVSQAVEKPNYPMILGNYLATSKEVCLENGKPIVYFFGTSTCPHCIWEKPIINEVMGKFGNEVVFKQSIDSQDYMDIYKKYNDFQPGYVPFITLGCKYSRVGGGESLGSTDAESVKFEKDSLTAITCKLTGGKPGSVCDAVKEKTAGIQ